ncbi:MAG: hypothetical protein HY335_00035, partial [Deinococcus sp.]|nr:hypothetical protein [Deinococcus sp.]
MAKKRGNGEGTLFRRQDGTWQGAVSLGYDGDGKRKRRTVYGKTQAGVRAKLDELKQQVASGMFSETRLTVRVHLDHWLAEKARQVKPRTVECYGHCIRAHIAPRLGRVSLTKLTPMHVQTMLGELADGVGGRTANLCRSLLFSAMKQAVRWQLISRNPVEAVDPLKVQSTALPGYGAGAEAVCSLLSGDVHGYEAGGTARLALAGHHRQHAGHPAVAEYGEGSASL